MLNATLRSATIKDEMLWCVTRNGNALIHILHTSYDSRKMRLPLYVCANCSQTFTRRSSASRHNSNLHFNQGIIVQMLEYIIGRSCGRFLPPNQLFNRRFRRPSFIRKQKMDNPESGFKSTIHDKSFGIKSDMLNKLNTHQFLYGDASIEPSDHISNKLSPNDHFDEFSRVSKLAEVRRLIVDHYGHSAALDNLLYGIEIYTSDPELMNVLDEYLAVLWKNCKYSDDLMQLSN